MVTDIAKIMTSVALVSIVFTGIMAEFVIPIVMIVGFGYKEIPFRTYIALWVAAATTTVGITLAFGLLASARYWRKTRLPFNKVVDEYNKFRACPLCNGRLERETFEGVMLMFGDARCQICGVYYRLHKRILLEDEFGLEGT